ncbi:MAG: DUF4160 domain-containing protein [Kiritimatiellaeota bacterium]|nr:DUF4160 domain-containing protein [Kiritimatiellota bacterium]
MPTIFTEDGFRFFFYSNDHHPIHVHVSHGDGEAVFEVGNGLALKEARGMSVKNLAKAERLAKRNIKLIKEKWNVFFT